MRFKIFLIAGILSYLFLQCSKANANQVSDDWELLCTCHHSICKNDPQFTESYYFYFSEDDQQVTRVRNFSTPPQHVSYTPVSVYISQQVVYVNLHHLTFHQNRNEAIFLKELGNLCAENLTDLQNTLKSILEVRAKTRGDQDYTQRNHFLFPLNLQSAEAKLALAQKDPACRLNQGQKIGAQWFVSSSKACFYRQKNSR